MYTSDYYNAPAGQNCPSDTVITSQEECEAASIQLNHKMMPKHQPNNKRPAGCFSAYASGVSAFNPMTDPSATSLNNKKSYGGVCKSKGIELDF